MEKRLAVAGGDRGRCLHKAGEGAEERRSDAAADSHGRRYGSLTRQVGRVFRRRKRRKPLLKLDAAPRHDDSPRDVAISGVLLRSVAPGFL
jgi:hypothetical protein